MTPGEFIVEQHSWELGMRFRMAKCLALVTIGMASHPMQALGQETTTYTYDALGRLITVQHSGGPADGTAATYSYDLASNRTNVTVTLSGGGGSGSGAGGGSGGNGDPGAGASVSPHQFIVLPLDGYKVIPIAG